MGLRLSYLSHAYMLKRADQANLSIPRPMSWMCYDTYETTEEKQAHHGVPFPSHGWPTVHPTESQNLASTPMRTTKWVGNSCCKTHYDSEYQPKITNVTDALLFMLSLNTPVVARPSEVYRDGRHTSLDTTLRIEGDHVRGTRWRPYFSLL